MSKTKSKLTKKFIELCISKLPNSLQWITPDKILSGSWIGKCLLCDNTVGQVFYRLSRERTEVHELGVSSCCAGRICYECENQLKMKRNIFPKRSRSR